MADIHDRLRRLQLRRDPDGIERKYPSHKDYALQIKSLLHAKGAAGFNNTEQLQAAGALIYAKDTGKFLVVKRGPDVGDPDLWCSVGGKIENGETPEAAARREIWEEIGYGGENKDQPLELTPAYLYDKPALKFYNHVGVVPKEFIPVLNWESADYKWCDLHDIPQPEHYGLSAMLEDQDTMDTIDGIVANRHVLHAAVNPDLPFLSKLGVPTYEQARIPNADTFPRAFNMHGLNAWKEAVRGLDDCCPEEGWMFAIRSYMDICLSRGVFPFSNMHQSSNDAITSELNSARKQVVKFLNRSGLLKLVTVKKTQREVKLTAHGFTILVSGNIVLKDPTFLDWLQQSPMPRFDIVRENNRYVKKLTSNTKMVVFNEGANLPDRWHVGYEITINRFPEVPGNHVPTAAELAAFILEVLYMPVLTAHRPFGHVHRLL